MGTLFGFISNFLVKSSVLQFIIMCRVKTYNLKIKCENDSHLTYFSLLEKCLVLFVSIKDN